MIFWLNRVSIVKVTARFASPNYKRSRGKEFQSLADLEYKRFNIFNIFLPLSLNCTEKIRKFYNERLGYSTKPRRTQFTFPTLMRKFIRQNQKDKKFWLKFYETKKMFKTHFMQLQFHILQYFHYGDLSVFHIYSLSIWTSTIDTVT